jgi:hypothetical protein
VRCIGPESTQGKACGIEQSVVWWHDMNSIFEVIQVRPRLD